ncbi:hypothetical protein Hanom_Chr11g01058901 [Helianthus anomalus]
MVDVEAAANSSYMQQFLENFKPNYTEFDETCDCKATELSKLWSFNLRYSVEMCMRR